MNPECLPETVKGALDRPDGRGRLAWHVSVLQCAFIP